MIFSSRVVAARRRPGKKSRRRSLMKTTRTCRRSSHKSNTLKFCVLLVSLIFLAAPRIPAQTLPEGIWQGYDGEWLHVTSQLVALAEATPEDKFSWRPAPGVRSTSEVYMHIAEANFYLLSVTGPQMPADMMSDDVEKTVTKKADV